MLDFLNTIPDMTNTPEITMQEPKTPMSKQIRAYKAANPDASDKQIAEAVGTTAVYVYQVLANPLKKVKKAGSATKQKENNVVNKKELDALKEEIETQRIVIDALKRTVEKNLAVIDYLENKIDDLGGLVC